MEISSGILGVLKDCNVDLSTKCTLCRNTFKLSFAVKSNLTVIQWMITRISSKLAKEDEVDNLRQLWCAFSDIAKNNADAFEEAFLVSCGNISEFMVGVSGDISSAIPSIEDFLLDVSLLGESDDLKRLRRSIQSQPNILNQILAMIFSKGHIWRVKKTDIVEKYRSYLQNAAGSDTFVDHLLTAFATDLADEKGSNDVVARAVFAGSPENRSAWALFFKSLVTPDCKPPTDCHVIERALGSASREVLVAVARSAMTAAASATSSKKSAKDAAVMLMITARAFNLSNGDFEHEVVLRDSLALSRVPRFDPNPIEDVASFNKVLASVPTTVLEADVQNPEGEKCSLTAWLLYTVKALVRDPKHHSDELTRLLCTCVDLSPTFLTPVLGLVACTVIFGPFSSDCQQLFVRKLLDCNVKLRQVPKLIAKLLITIQGGDGVGVSETLADVAEEETLQEFAKVVPLLPSAQLMETWKTFLYHLGSDNERVKKFCDQLMPILIEHGSFVDHTLPMTFVEKAVHFMNQTDECKEDTPRIERAVVRLRELMSLYRQDQLKGDLKRSSSDMPVQSPPNKKAKNILDVESVQESFALQVECVRKCVGGIGKAMTATDKHLKKAHGILADNIAKLDEENSSDYENALKDIFRHVLKHLSHKTSTPLQVPADMKDLLSVLPLEHLRGPLESTVSALLLAARDFVLLGRCWDQSFRSTNTLKYLQLGDLLPQVTALEKGQLTASRMLTRTCVNYHKPLAEFEPFLEKFCDLFATDDSAPPTLMIEALEKPLSYPDLSEEKRVLCQKYFDVLSKSMLKALKKDSIQLQSDLTIRGLASFYAIKLAGGSTDQDKKGLGVKVLPKCVEQASASLGPSNIKFLQAVAHGYPTLSRFKELDGVYLRMWRRAVDQGCHDIMSALISKSDPDLFEQMMAANGALDVVPTIIVLVKTPLGDDEVKSDLRRKAVQDAIVRFCAGPVDTLDPTSLCHLQQALLETDKPVLTSHSEAFLLRRIPMTEAVFRHSGQKEFQRVWLAVHSVFSAMMHKRFGFLVKTRTHLALSLMRNLFDGLVAASDQNNQHQDIPGLVTLSHYWDRSTEQVKSMKEDFGRIVAYFVADVLDGFQRVTVLPSVKTNLQSGLNKLLDMCDKHSIDYLVGVLPSGRKEIFKDMVATYKTYHKYTGKV